MHRDFHALRVRERREEIKGAVTVVFEVPEHLAEIFAWRPGQHLTLRFTLKGEEVRRSYSISASPVSGDPLQITVKRVAGGLVSNHINDRVRAGDTIDVMPPFGTFRLDPGDRLRRTHYFFGAGSGITPLVAMLQSVLIAEPYSVAHLIYGNRSADTILLKGRLEDLRARYPGRLTVSHVLSRPSMWSSFSHWRRGLVDKAAVEAAINENPPYAQDTQYYICGPGKMNQTVRDALMGLDVPANRLHMESYGGAIEVDGTITGVAAEARIHLSGCTHTVAIPQGQTILQATRAAGLSPPFSCQSGVCGACRANLVNGSVHMRARLALEDEEAAAGAILTCQSIATTGALSVVFE